jgi:hypothetical protein
MNEPADGNPVNHMTAAERAQRHATIQQRMAEIDAEIRADRVPFPATTLMLLRADMAQTQGPGGPGGCRWVDVVTSPDDLAYLRQLRTDDPGAARGFVTEDEYNTMITNQEAT